jgi:DNA-binding NarL/FixJ family response regulator
MVTSARQFFVMSDQAVRSRGSAPVLRHFTYLLLAAEAATAEEALELCATARPDVILLTLHDPAHEATDALRAIGEGYPSVGIVVLPEDCAEGRPQRALPPPAHGSDLTHREREVLALMAHGLTNGQIGTELVISRATVKFHVSSILGKLGAVTRTEAVAFAVQMHLTAGPA